MPFVKTAGGQRIDSATGVAIVSREAVFMFRLGTKIYKVLADTQNNANLMNAWRTAVDNFGLPTPYVNFTKTTYSAAIGGASTACYLIEMKDVSAGNTFFQFSHGGVAVLTARIAGQTDKDRVKRLQRAFEAGKRCGLMDPQGFYSVTAADPIVFIDVHTRAVENAAFDPLILACQTRHAQL